MQTLTSASAAPAGLGRRQPGHGDHPPDAQQGSQLDGVADVPGVLGPDLGVGVERVAVAVEGGQGDAGVGEQPQILLAGVLAGAQVVDRQGDGGKEPARVDLGRVQAELAQGPQGVGDGLVVQAGGVGTELHLVSSGQAMGTSAPPALAEAATASSRRMLWSPSANEATRGSRSSPATCSRKARAWKMNRSFWP